MFCYVTAQAKDVSGKVARRWVIIDLGAHLSIENLQNGFGYLVVISIKSDKLMLLASVVNYSYGIIIVCFLLE